MSTHKHTNRTLETLVLVKRLIFLNKNFFFWWRKMLIIRLTFLLPIYQVVSLSFTLSLTSSSFICISFAAVTISVEASWRKCECGFNYNEFRFGDFIIKCICHLKQYQFNVFFRSIGFAIVLVLMLLLMLMLLMTLL